MFGAVNSLFSGAAFAGITFTIFLQKRELQLQREEMRRVAASGETSAHLAALSQLISHYEDLKESLREMAFREVRDSHQAGGIRVETISQEAANQFGEATNRHAQLLAELERVYDSLTTVDEQ